LTAAEVPKDKIPSQKEVELGRDQRRVVPDIAIQRYKEYVYELLYYVKIIVLSLNKTLISVLFSLSYA
jgi:hypothetical protein